MAKSDFFGLRRATMCAGLVLTPHIVFISSSVDLFTRNLRDFGYDATTLLPIACLGLLFLVVGAVLWWLPENPFTRFLSWLYFLFGPLLILWRLLSGIVIVGEDAWQYTVFAALLIVAAVALAVFSSPRKVIGLFALFAVLLAVSDGLKLLNAGRSADGVQVSELVQSDQNLKRALPNVYHILFDGFQSDMFEYLLDKQQSDKFNGFVFYRENLAAYNHTVWSVPSVFGGRSYDFKQSMAEYQDQSWNGDNSLPGLVKKLGYRMEAFTRPLYNVGLTKFDRVIEHIDNVGGARIDNNRAFAAVWLYQNLPTSLVKLLADSNIVVGPEDIDRLKGGAFLPDSAPAESRLSYENLMRLEETESPFGRYVFVHLLYPHDPYVLGSRCKNEKKTDVSTQSQCAMNTMANFIDELKRLGRFDNSVILIHGDHGDRYDYFPTLKSFVPRVDKSRSPRTLLLFKKQGVGDAEAIVRSEFQSTLLDIAPTMMNMLAGQVSREFEGMVLPESTGPAIAGGRVRQFHVVEGNGMKRFTFKDNSVVSVELVPYPNEVASDVAPDSIPLFSTDHEVEAEEGHGAHGLSGEDFPDTKGQYIRTGGGKIYYRFSIPRSGRYRFQLRAIAPNGNNDSLFLTIGSERRIAWFLKSSKKWVWQSPPKEANLIAGEIIVKFEPREQVWIDQLKLVKIAD